MYIVSCESTCDLNLFYLMKRDCSVICYTYAINGKEYEDDMGKNPKALEELYTAMKTQRPTTSQINVERYQEYFEEQLQYSDVLHVTFSSGLSSSANNAFLAAQNIAKKQFDHKLVVVDSACGGGGYGLFVEGLLNQRDNGLGFNELCTWAQNNRMKVNHYFYSTDLTYFKRSGRVSGATMVIGNLLHLCPIMKVQENGKIVAYAKAISEKKAISKLVAEMKANADNNTGYDGKVLIQHSNCLKSAQKVREAIVAEFANLSDVQIADVGTVMACHCGPNTVAIYFWGRERSVQTEKLSRGVGEPCHCQ